MSKRLSSINTVPFSVFLLDKDPSKKDLFEREYGDLYYPMIGDLVQYHKGCLGRQDFCFTSSRRYWVWTGESGKWCVYINNITGVQFEVDPSCSLEEAWSFWKSFRERISTKAEDRTEAEVC